VKRLFVTGGHGFVGQWLQRVARETATRHRFEITVPPFDFDLLDPVQVDRELAGARPDAVLHLAAQANVPLSFKDPEGAYRVNFTGTLRLFEGLKRAGLAPRVVFVSSGDIYGCVPEAGMPVAEERAPRPRNPYAVSKVAAEALSFQWSCSEGLDVTIARPFNHIGAGQSDAFVLPAFARQIAEIKAGMRAPVIETGDIDVSRDFTHVADIAEAYLILLEKGRTGETYNICSGVGLRVRDLLNRLLDLSGVKAEVRRDPARFRPAEQRVVKGDNARICGLGWSPRRSVDDALREILADWEQRTKNG
jgi:GDP-4-dehydro-6-deoxy-D-mannose reductase